MEPVLQLLPSTGLPIQPLPNKFKLIPVGAVIWPIRSKALDGGKCALRLNNVNHANYITARRHYIPAHFCGFAGGAASNCEPAFYLNQFASNITYMGKEARLDVERSYKEQYPRWSLYIYIYIIRGLIADFSHLVLNHIGAVSSNSWELRQFRLENLFRLEFKCCLYSLFGLIRILLQEVDTDTSIQKEHETDNTNTCRC